MSTKSSIRWQKRTEESEGFHLYKDVFEKMSLGENALIYLELEGVGFAVETIPGGGGFVRLALSQGVARALGLISSDL